MSNIFVTQKTVYTSISPASVLLVEDSLLIRDTLIDLIDVDPRCKVLGFVNSEINAIEILKTNSFDILILDLQLRQGSGIGVLDWLMLQNNTRPALKIVLTNFDNALFRNRCYDAGADFFFDKSREFEFVSEVLNRWLTHGY